MCGIFGIIAKPSTDFVPENFEKTLGSLFTLSQTRGSEASGVAFLSDNEISVLKSPLSASRFIRTSEFGKLKQGYLKQAPEKQPYVVIGHSRMVTNGSRGDNFNNQPVVSDSLVGIHNGIVVNVDDLWSKYKELPQKADVDSEVLFKLLDRFLNETKSLPDAVQKTFSEVEGAASIASLFSELNCALIATNHGSLYTCENPEKDIVVFASEHQILKNLIEQSPTLQGILKPESIQQLRAGTAAVIDLGSPELQRFSITQEIDSLTVSNGCHRSVREIASATKAKLAPADTSKVDEATMRAVATAKEKYPHDTTFTDSLKRCTKCILPETMPFIEFNSEGVCNYCENYQPIEYYGRDKLNAIADKVRSKDGSADCLVGLSGGRDSCYGLHVIKEELGLNPVAYTYDWGLVTDLARRNISRMCGKLGIEHILVSANIPRKRHYVKMNVATWLKRPRLGVIPLFMAGDKAYFNHANRLKKQLGISQIFLCENMLERTDFKIGFAGLRPSNIDPDRHFTLSAFSQGKILWYYLRNYLENPGYLNSSLIDTFLAYMFYYIQTKDYANLFKYIPWEEDTVVDVLRNVYDWELAKDTTSTWRIGDGTASFYNYLYYKIVGFTENDTFRSNQIREGIITREYALQKSEEENHPRFDSMKWYCDIIGVDFEQALAKINTFRPLEPDALR